MPEILRHGGRQFDWRNTLITVDGQPRRGFTSFDFSDKLDIETVYSQTQDGVPLGPTGGQYQVDSFNLKMLTEYWADPVNGLLAYLSDTALGVNGDRGPIGSYGLTTFHLQLSISDDYLPSAPVIHYDCVPCRIMSAKPAGAKGPAALETDLTIWCLQVKVNGRTLYAPAVGG